MGCSPPTILEQVTDGSENKEINSEIEAKGMLRMFPPPYNPIRRIRIFFLNFIVKIFWMRPPPFKNDASSLSCSAFRSDLKTFAAIKSDNWL